MAAMLKRSLVFVLLADAMRIETIATIANSGNGKSFGNMLAFLSTGYINSMRITGMNNPAKQIKYSAIFSGKFIISPGRP